jgi:hypothetical protein
MRICQLAADANFLDCGGTLKNWRYHYQAVNSSRALRISLACHAYSGRRDFLRESDTSYVPLVIDPGVLYDEEFRMPVRPVISPRRRNGAVRRPFLDDRLTLCPLLGLAL